jgi:hypothetical protein
VKRQNRNAGNQDVGDCSIQGNSFGQRNSLDWRDFEPSVEQLSSGRDN